MITVIIHYYTIRAVEVEGLLYVFFVLIPLIISHKFHAFYIGIFAHANKSKSKLPHLIQYVKLAAVPLHSGISVKL